MTLPVILGRDARTPLEIDADVVVVGSGSGGAVVACELAEAGQEVVVLEEGPHFAPAEYGAMRPTESMRHIWRDGALSFALGVGGGPTINVMMGRCIGGSSVLTGGVCFRTPEAVLDEWTHDRGIPRVSPREMDACFASVERAVHVEEVPVSLRSRSTELFALGASRLGFELSPMKRNTKDCNGCGRCNFGCPHGAKQSVDVSYLPRAVRAGARLYADCLVDRVVVRGDRAVGVEGSLLDGARARSRGRFRVRARRVVVAAGAYHSPLLLARSGLGRASGQIGRNMTLHPGFRVMARFDEPVRGWAGALQSAWTDRYQHDRATLTGLFIPVGALAATMPGIGPAHVARAKHIPNLAIFGGLIHDDGGGTVRAAPFGREPIATYEMSARDRAAMPLLWRRMAEVFFAAGAREVFLPVLGMDGLDADAFRRVDLDHVPGSRIECSSQHPLGTCRMGVSPNGSVVDPDGQVWGVKDLYVADGSVLPTSLGVNPQLSVMAMATRLAWGMRERRLPDRSRAA